MVSLHLVSLGCPKNLVDSELMLGLLEQADWQIVEDAHQADLLLINTCGFIQSAVEEAIDEILELSEVKREDPGKSLVVTGCLVQRYGAELMAELPEVDLFLGTEAVPDIVARITALRQGRWRTGSGSRAVFLWTAACLAGFQPRFIAAGSKSPRAVTIAVPIA